MEKELTDGKMVRNMLENTKMESGKAMASITMPAGPAMKVIGLKASKKVKAQSMKAMMR